MPVQRNPRSSAGPTASGLPLEPQITIPLLSEQEAQDPAVPANVPQPFVAENKKRNVRNQLCRQPQAARSTALEALAVPASTMRQHPPGSLCPAQHVPLLHMTWRFATQTRRPVVAAKGPCCCGTANLDDSPTTCVEKLRVPETAAPRPGNVGSLTEKPTISHEIYLITKTPILQSPQARSFPKTCPKI